MSPGYRNYLIGLTTRLRALPSVGALEIFTSRRSLMAADPAVAANGTSTSTRSIRRAVRAFGADIVLSPAARAFRCSPIPTVAMVWNMEPLQAPRAGNTIREVIRNLARRAAIWRGARKARLIHVPSGLVLRFLVERWHIPPEKIRLVPLAAEPPLGGSDAHPPAGVPVGVPFIFTAAGSLRPARGVGDGIDALAVLARRGVRPTLVIAGAATHGTTAFVTMLRDRARVAGVADQIVWAGHLDRSQMAWCFMNAEMFIATTRAEALSVLLLEALTYRCKTVATDVETAREVFGDSALYYRPGDGASLAEAIIAMAASDESETARRREASDRQAVAFDWDTVTTGMLSLLQEAGA